MRQIVGPAVISLAFLVPPPLGHPLRSEEPAADDPRDAEVQALKEEIRQLKESHADDLERIEERLESLEDSPSSLEPWPGFEFHGYLRSGFGVDTKGNTFEAFQAPNSEAKYRLGNEAETYAETTFRQRYTPEEVIDASFYGVITFALYTPTSGNNAFDTTFSLREAYAVAEGVFKPNPSTKFWAGQRFYDRYQNHINDFWYRDMSGFGGGLEDVSVFDAASFAFAWLGGSIDQLESDGTAVPENDFQLSMNTLDFRLYGIDAPGGEIGATFDVSFFDGDRFTIDGFGPFELEDSTGWSVGVFHESHPLPSSTNVLQVQYGTSVASNFKATISSPLGVTPADLALLEIDDLWKLRVLDHIHVDFDGPFSLLGMLVFQELDNGLPAANRLSWYSAGVRPSWAFAKYFALDLEVGVDYTSQDDGPNGTLVKATLAPQIRPQVSVLSRPSIRTFFTYAYWTGGFKGLVSTRSYGNDQHGFVVGIQLETWW